jgi:hypothetical protein
MLTLEVKTKLSQEEIMDRAKRYFGEGGLGLHLKDENPQCVNFEGGGGYVSATVCEEGGETRVDLVTQEWEYQVKEFASKIA